MAAHAPDAAGDQRQGVSAAGHLVFAKLDASRATWGARAIDDLWIDFNLLRPSRTASDRVHLAALTIFLLECDA